MSGPLTSLCEYLLCLVCLELSLADITSLRQTCQVCAARNKDQNSLDLYLGAPKRPDSTVVSQKLRAAGLTDAGGSCAKGVALAHKWETENLTRSYRGGSIFLNRSLGFVSLLDAGSLWLPQTAAPAKLAVGIYHQFSKGPSSHLQKSICGTRRRLGKSRYKNQALC
ncbi:hypothetical protein B0H14DRAFT_3134928 [Mycena olivaceomarginata]|nr:hypothetical protein B0H14DRAFT_3134928 [Mycena olivaceomarginata]